MPDGELDRLVARRRTLLNYHQALGIGTLAVMAVTTILGQLNYHDLYVAETHTGDYLWPHRIGVGASTLGFFGTGALAMLAPKPFKIETHGFDARTIHRVGTLLASAGMVTEVVLGFVAARQADTGNPADRRSLARTHEVVGYSTLGVLTIAAGAWVF